MDDGKDIMINPHDDDHVEGSANGIDSIMHLPPSDLADNDEPEEAESEAD